MALIRPPSIQTESLPRLCNASGCIKDPLPGELLCNRCKQRQQTKKRYPRADYPPQGTEQVYAIRGERAIKFGRTTNLRSRFSALKAENASPVELYGYVTFHPWLEKAIHLELAAHRSHGEWFRFHTEVERIADYLRNKDFEALFRLGHHVGIDFESRDRTHRELNDNLKFFGLA
jgi:Meiotically up-regulated gene 113